VTDEQQCGRRTWDGAGFQQVCQLPLGHTGAHISRVEGIVGAGLTWTHEDYRGHAVWPEARGAQDVTGKESRCLPS